MFIYLVECLVLLLLTKAVINMCADAPVSSTTRALDGWDIVFRGFFDEPRGKSEKRGKKDALKLKVPNSFPTLSTQQSFNLLGRCYRRRELNMLAGSEPLYTRARSSSCVLVYISYTYSSEHTSVESDSVKQRNLGLRNNESSLSLYLRTLCYA